MTDRRNCLLQADRTTVVTHATKLIGACMLVLALPVQAQPIESYHGPCDASAAVALDAERFVVANDETNRLYIYRRGTPQPESSVDMSIFLDTGPGIEADIEGAAVLGDRIYWITSHGRNSSGKRQSARLRLFATDIRSGPALAPVGKPYTKLLDDLTESIGAPAQRLAAAARLPPEADGGLNIEGLAATPDGKLLIGFRSPLREGRALIVPLENPAAVIAGERAKLGAPIELGLAGRGIRSINRIGSSYLLVAGPTGDQGTFGLYRWSGAPGDPATAVALDLQDLRPEAMFAVPNSNRVQLLSDDGGLSVQGKSCKALPLAQQRFRSLTITAVQNP